MKSPFHSLFPFLPFLLNHLRLPSPDATQFSTTTDCSAWLRCLYSTTSVLYFRTLLIITLHGPRGKHSLYCWRGLFTAALPSNRLPTVARVGSRGNVFTESLINNGYTRTFLNFIFKDISTILDGLRVIQISQKQFISWGEKCLLVHLWRSQQILG
jgi:hypothetical protein